jgi:hypothetical protein
MIQRQLHRPSSQHDQPRCQHGAPYRSGLGNSFGADYRRPALGAAVLSQKTWLSRLREGASVASVHIPLAESLCPEKRTTDKSLMFNRNHEGSDLLPALSPIDFLGTSWLLPSFSGC